MGGRCCTVACRTSPAAAAATAAAATRGRSAARIGLPSTEAGRPRPSAARTVGTTSGWPVACRMSTSGLNAGPEQARHARMSAGESEPCVPSPAIPPARLTFPAEKL